MNTSYFAKSSKHPYAVSIASRAPAGYGGREFRDLAPKQWFLFKYKKDGDEKFYTEQYRKEVLDKLDPKKVFEELGENAVLLCWEGKGKFCHRRLVADWFKEKLNTNIPELE